MSSLVRAKGLWVDYGREPVLQDASLVLASGELVGLIGRNGAGKTTLIRTLLGLLPRDKGEIWIEDDPIEQLSRREIARRVAYVPQEAERRFAFRVRELVAMGRNPYLGAFRPEGEHDRARIATALRDTDTLNLAERPIAELSGGEWRRVVIARALAQDTTSLLIDEPVANLDLAHQHEVMTLLRALADRGRAVLVSIHDLSLASIFCDRLLLLGNGAIVAADTPAAVLRPELLATYFGIRARVSARDRGLIIDVIEPAISTEDMP